MLGCCEDDGDADDDDDGDDDDDDFPCSSQKAFRAVWITNSGCVVGEGCALGITKLHGS